MAEASDGMRGHFERIDAIANAAFELAEYERWLAKSAAVGDDYLFAEARARFEPDDLDVLRRAPDLLVSATATGVELRSPSAGGSVHVPGVSREIAERLLARCEGTRTLAEQRALAGADRAALEHLLASAFGSLLFAPDAVLALESRLSGTELVRFVGTPYELVRSYWRNAVDVSETADDALGALDDVHHFVNALRRLHVILLLGRELDRFYRPASRITTSGVRPGALYTSASRTLETTERTLLLGGPRVGVALIGGEIYHALVCAEDEQALAPERRIADEDGLDWGRVVRGRALDESKDGAWFLPPRPASAEHFAKLFAAYAGANEASERRQRDALIGELARFHYRFVRLHPFRCANQSLGMLLVNRLLARALGAGIPHLVLDQLALRLNETAYVAVFGRAVNEHCVARAAAERWHELRRRKLDAYAMIERLKPARDIAEARRIARAAPEQARAALIDV